MTTDNQTWDLTLNRYQRDNLLSLINALGFGADPILPFQAFNTGDWVGEIGWALARVDGSVKIDEKDQPVLTRQELLERLSHINTPAIIDI